LWEVENHSKPLRMMALVEQDGELWQFLRKFCGVQRFDATLGGCGSVPFYCINPDVSGKNTTIADHDLTGLKLWPGTELMCRWLHANRAESVSGRTVLDLGAGTGCVGMSALAFGAKHAVLSDCNELSLETIFQRRRPEEDGAHGV
jgi:hypothetical protein